MTDQLDLLANFIMAEVPGEPSRDEGAGDCAIRLIKQYMELLHAVNAYRFAHSAAEAHGGHMVDYTGNLNDRYAAMLVLADEGPTERKAVDA